MSEEFVKDGRPETASESGPESGTGLGGTDRSGHETFSRLAQINLAITIFGIVVLATPVLFVIASIGTGAGMVRLGLSIAIVWLLLIVCSVIFARQASRHGYLGK